MRHYILLILLAFVSLTASADCQQPRQKPDFKSIVEKRFCVIVHELELDEAKAAKLKPLYMEYCRQMGDLFKPQPNKKPRDQRTDAEIEQDIKADFDRAKKMINLRETYYTKIRKLLTPKQIEKIYSIERDEQRKINQHRMQKLQNKK